MARVTLTGGYRLIDGPPDVEDYLQLRLRAGLSPKRPDQAAAGIGGAWAAVHVISDSGGTVGMGRVLGDGGWYFHVLDMAVLPEHQRRGLGDAILAALLERVRRGDPPGAYVSLMADPPGRNLYRRHGFRPTSPGSLGMAQLLA